MARRPTVTDLARQAGVSVATVDRVLNGRHAVRKDTAARVLRAAEALGYHATGLIGQRLREEVPARRLGFLLLQRTVPFYQALAAALVEATRAAGFIRGRPVIEFMETLSPATIVASMAEIGSRVDALAVVAVDHPHVSEAVVALRARGVPVFALLSDLTAEARAGSIGIDDRKAGRTAGWMIARLARPGGAIGVLVGSHRFLGHELREIGFRSYMREHAPDFRLLETAINLEDDRLAHEATLELLRRHRDLAGLFVAGGGVAGVIRAMREEAPDGHVAMVCSELTSETRAALIDGIAIMSIGTPVAALAARAVELMARAIDAVEPQPPVATLLPFEVWLAENI